MAAPGSASLLASLPTPRTRLIGRETERVTARALLLEEAVPLLTLQRLECMVGAEGTTPARA
jgi:hypothetical protein